MNLIDENIEKESQEKQKKLTKIIIFTIIALVMLVIVILLYSAIKSKNTLKFSIDGKSTSVKPGLFLMDNSKKLYTAENGQIYFSVKDLASMLGVEIFNDEFKVKGEDTTKCYIKTENEYTSYVSNSPNIYKVIDNKTRNAEPSKNKDELSANNYEYEYFTVNNDVMYVNDKIYASKQAIELGFNLNITYDAKNKSIKVLTLNKLQTVADSKIKALAIKENIDYRNKKLLKYGLVLIKNSTQEYGVTDYFNYREGNPLISCKYSNIKFIESLGCFIVTTSDTNEQGILKIDLNRNGGVKTLVNPKYEEINQLSEDGTLYVTKENGKYGILKITDDGTEVKTETMLKSEYQTIGVDNFNDYDNMTTRYIINNKYIPIKADGKWGLASLEGRVIITPQYDFIGCSTGESGKPVICVPELIGKEDAIVFGNLVTDEVTGLASKKYLLINASKNGKIGYDALEIYSVNENNNRSYYMKIEAADQSVHKLNIYNTYKQ